MRKARLNIRRFDGLQSTVVRNWWGHPRCLSPERYRLWIKLFHYPACQIFNTTFARVVKDVRAQLVYWRFISADLSRDDARGRASYCLPVSTIRVPYKYPVCNNQKTSFQSHSVFRIYCRSSTSIRSILSPLQP